MLHAAFRGQTPDEVFFGTASNLPAQLAAARAKARELRMAANRARPTVAARPPPDQLFRRDYAHGATAYAPVRNVLVRSSAAHRGGHL
jgi:hypothetical protein